MARTHFDNTDRKGGSWQCRPQFCTSRNAICVNGSSGCCECQCNRGRIYDGNRCILRPTTSATTRIAITTIKTPKTRTSQATTPKPTINAKTTTTRSPNTRVAVTTTRSTKGSTSRPTTKLKTTTSARITETASSTTKESTTYRIVTTADSGTSILTSSANFKSSSATNSPTKSSVSRTNSPQTTKRITTTTASQGDKKMVAGGNDSHAGLIAGICVGFLVLIVCVVLILYFRKRKQKPKKVPEFVGSSDGFKFQDLKSRNEAERPVSPNGIYEYAYNKNVIGNPTYNAAIPMSEPFYSDLDGRSEHPVYREVFDEAGTGEQPIYREVCDDEQPVYKEIVANEVYMSPEAAGHQEQPLYREVEEGVPISPIYREIDADAPIYAMADKAVDAKAQQAAAGQDPSTYQQLNYAATANVYQGLSDDWKNQKYDR